MRACVERKIDKKHKVRMKIIEPRRLRLLVRVAASQLPTRPPAESAEVTISPAAKSKAILKKEASAVRRVKIPTYFVQISSILRHQK
jgi:hypothetical protein